MELEAHPWQVLIKTFQSNWRRTSTVPNTCRVVPAIGALHQAALCNVLVAGAPRSVLTLRRPVVVLQLAPSDWGAPHPSGTHPTTLIRLCTVTAYCVPQPQQEHVHSRSQEEAMLLCASWRVRLRCSCLLFFAMLHVKSLTELVGPFQNTAAENRFQAQSRRDELRMLPRSVTVLPVGHR